jgi:hypothetical protein
VLQASRAQFEALLLEIAEYAEEWLTSAQALGVTERRPAQRTLSWDRPVSAPARPHRVRTGAASTNGRQPAGVEGLGR